MIRQYNASRCRGGDNPLRVGTIAVGSIYYIQDEGFFRERYSPRAICRNPWIVEAFLNGTMGAARRNGITGLWEDAFISGRSDTAVVRSLRDGRRRTIGVGSLVVHDDLFLTMQPTRYPDLPNLALYRGRYRRRDTAAAPQDPPVIAARIARLTASLRRTNAIEADRMLCQRATDDLLAIGQDLGLRLPRAGGDKPAAIVAALGKRGKSRIIHVSCHTLRRSVRADRGSNDHLPRRERRHDVPKQPGRTHMTDDRQPTADEQAGVDWWNGLSEVARGYWLRQARTPVPAEAWAEYKRQLDKA